jgi:hypothetical protein
VRDGGRHLTRRLVLAGHGGGGGGLVGGGAGQLPDDERGRADLERVADGERLGCGDAQAVHVGSVGGAEILDGAEAAGVERDPGVQAGDLLVVGEPADALDVTADDELVVDLDPRPGSLAGHDLETCTR